VVHISDIQVFVPRSEDCYSAGERHRLGGSTTLQAGIPEWILWSLQERFHSVHSTNRQVSLRSVSIHRHSLFYSAKAGSD